ncbi:hypothetical protein, partial [Roseateles puraquae]|uniref:hypothetical protein n=1 Tax=Roseateles puraquae TaxID=431059 RepID=UPI002407F700
MASDPGRDRLQAATAALALAVAGVGLGASLDAPRLLVAWAMAAGLQRVLGEVDEHLLQLRRIGAQCQRRRLHAQVDPAAGLRPC